MNKFTFVPTSAVSFRNPLPSPRIISDVTILEGDWDLDAIPLVDSPMYQSIKGFIERGTPMKVSGYYKRLKQKPPEQVKDTIQYRVRKLRDSILEKGVIPVENDNIRVAIGRNGALIAVDGGTHRLILAHILGIPQIPVEVMGRHPEWEAFRQKTRKLESIIYQQLPHPDLQDWPWYFNNKRADLIRPYIKGKTLIDLGCRYGAECHRMEDEGWVCTGIESDTAVVGVAKVLHDSLNRNFSIWHGDATQIPPMTADVLLAYNVLVYLRQSPDYVKMLNNLHVNQVVFSAQETDKGANGSLDAAHQVADLMGKTNITCIGTDESARHPKRCTSIGSRPRKIYIIE